MADSSQSSTNPNPSSSSKHQKLSTETENSIDRLPDSILCHILSFLPTKLAASTSILSTRWQFLWTMVPNIDLDDEQEPDQNQETPPNLDSDDDQESGQNQGTTPTPTSFTNFVYRIFNLRNRDLCLKRFRLKCGSNFDPAHVDSWVNAAVSGGIEELDLALCFKEPFFVLPGSIFSSKTLTVLKLSRGLRINLPSSVQFPSLKTLHLLWVEYENDDTPSSLFSCCPVLEDLVVKRDGADGVEDRYDISSPTLRNLVVEFASDYEEYYTYTLRVNAPSLESLELSDFVSEVFSFRNLDNLDDATFYVYPGDVDEEISSDDSKLYALQAVRNVRFLQLGHGIIHVLCHASFDDFPIFHNLILLGLYDFCCQWNMLQNLLVKLPNLRYLVIVKSSKHCHRCSYLGEEPRHWMPPPQVPHCLSFNLMTFYIEGAFQVLEGDMEFARYILKNSMVLTEMVITPCSSLDLKERFAVVQKLAMFERGSKECELKFDQ